MGVVVVVAGVVFGVVVLLWPLFWVRVLRYASQRSHPSRSKHVDSFIMTLLRMVGMPFCARARRKMVRLIIIPFGLGAMGRLTPPSRCID